ncbi:conserved hypothetical protein [Methylocella tundrae]|uniref:Nucleotide modification associated domain-containing protein n=2 Tax=Methylocella tundrae TaxID=227605 RepID=A0A8B6MAS2_METTU|nr:conserved hypothetical protein [Methylocella tundrae]VTZ51174.1 conserved hypothetical protein [Methylocella tundrae]
MYVVARDFGFAPNPFHGVCTLATCKPIIRRTAKVGDWVIGMGGSKLSAVGRCIFAMQITEAMSFDAYWAAPAYQAKRPVRNGSRKTIVGDNIYHRTVGSDHWQQEDSHHSQPDGTPDQYNIQNDTQTDRILISDHFWYFGNVAPIVPDDILNNLRFHNARGHRRYPLTNAQQLLSWLEEAFPNKINHVLGDPFQFAKSSARYSKKSDQIM